jgi:hypothetical protein
LKNSFDELLRRFCDLECDRFLFLTTLLEWKEIPFDVLSGGGKHILVSTRGSKPFLQDHCRKILVAHYDRVPGSPGANDNSAAVFMLLKHIDLLIKADYSHNTLILFTDKEELLEGNSIHDQGAWQLAELWPDSYRDKDLFIVLDMCGIGDTLIWGRTAGKLPGINLSRVNYIYESLKDLLHRYSRREDMDINDLCSDDLGFLLQGLTALQISLLPWKEAQEWKKNTPSQLPGKKIETVENIKKSIRSLPASWQINHSPEDKVGTLDLKSFQIMESFLRDLSRYQIPLP